MAIGLYPETAVTRMCWARPLAIETFGDPAQD
jgi:hypothetical protein